MTSLPPASAQRLLTSHECHTVCVLCQLIIPPDEYSAGAVEAGAPEFIGLLARENSEYYRIISGGLLWLDATCRRKYNNVFCLCTAIQQQETLDLIAYRETDSVDTNAGPSKRFFALLRKLTVDAFFTSRIGLRDLQYVGNTPLLKFNGCLSPVGEPSKEASTANNNADYAPQYESITVNIQI